MISQKAQYALKALVVLARLEPGEAITTVQIAEKRDIPRKFLEQILLELKRHGLVASKRGRDGGYMLLRSADKITFGEVLRIVDGPLAPLPCLSKVAYRRCEGCTDEESCEVRRVFKLVTSATRAVLDRATIEDAITTDDDDLAQFMVSAAA
ncbi:transcriptional regulator [Acuticoccus sediminis]|uniref:Transcriptional regulator n=1 Tax=Acuticoccus sediminis TaxID=2184697 RepID=A0A8B2P0Y9_9HYPH|nr:Rrf2 family transcriptional regulator [Acuticoccus sediminis]RAI01937.1 transcriptional regulator [Acuticoccus sediminis]